MNTNNNCCSHIAIFAFFVENSRVLFDMCQICKHNMMQVHSNFHVAVSVWCILWLSTAFKRQDFVSADLWELRSLKTLETPHKIKYETEQQHSLVGRSTVCLILATENTCSPSIYMYPLVIGSHHFVIRNTRRRYTHFHRVFISWHATSATLAERGGEGVGEKSVDFTWSEPEWPAL